EELAKAVADGLGLAKMPEAADAARPTRTDLPASPALSILKNGPDSFAGRKVGALVTDGVDVAGLDALKDALKDEGATREIVAPKIGGVTASDGARLMPDHKIDGGPSVLFVAVAVLPAGDGAGELMAMPPARDWVADAFAHCKLIA